MKNLLNSNNDIKISFDIKTARINLDNISALKIVTPAMRNSEKFKQILASIKEIGIIEPPAVTLQQKSRDKYIILDGHLRIEALKLLGEKDVVCLLSKDDEAFTYNKHISRLCTVQEHKMILEAIKRGVSEEKIARALNLDIKNIIQKRDLIVGICPEAVDLLKDKMVAARVFYFLRRMKEVRQIEAAMLMNDANNYTASYASALYASTPKSHLSNPEQPKKVKGLDEDQMARMEAEMGSLQGEYRIIEENYGTDVLNLTVSKGYIGSLLGNVRIIRYLAQQHPEILAQFQKITEMASLDVGG